MSLDAKTGLPKLKSQSREFLERHIGPDEGEIAEMLAALGLASLDELIERAVPESIRLTEPLDLPGPVSELQATRNLRETAGKNRVFTSLIGAGYYGTITPAVLTRNLLENPGWYTAYTPYQPEISQGRLEALLNFQTMVSDLTAMDITNASMLDEGTAAAEAMTLLHRVNKAAAKGDANTFVVDADALPQTIEVICTRAAPLGIEVVIADPVTADLTGVFGALVQYPGTSGAVNELEPIIDRLHEGGALVAVAADLLALTLLVPPGEAGADCVVGTAQRFGVPMGFGGPHAGYLAIRDDYKRSLPGRLVGVSIDTEGRPALRLALQTREQHIRREKATSNICTAQVLLANIAGMYACWHGPDGLASIARRVHDFTCRMATSLRAAGFTVTETFFDTISVGVPAGTADRYLVAARDRRINLRLIDDSTLGMSFDQTTTEPVLDLVLEAFGVREALVTEAPSCLPTAVIRTSPILTHPVFSMYHSETEMLRYLRTLVNKDIALDRSMIPLGSCTMKLNAAVEMDPITWPEFAFMHPFAPADQTAGYRELISELESQLVEITGYDAVSLQPNAGSQGELAGLLAIAAFHRANGDDERTICLIPSSAHGTNAASAVMAGMQVVVTECDDMGNVDIDDLRAKIEAHSAQLAALMITYPSTHGVFETNVRDICALVHEHGGQVYLDGANLNAMVGVAKPGKFGADVSHLNLHKTFCIPHGGGGPGVGPIGVGAHLRPYLPGHLDIDGGNAKVGAVSAAPFGSAGILPIPHTYISLMGADGLRRATQVAILAANYIASRLKSHFPVLYTGPNDLVAHECILDTRIAKDAAGISVDDIAKRLIDYGFHAPTVSFPVVGTMMVEPTESESKAELDRFCDAMIAIRAEVDLVASGVWPADNNPLVNAPHTAEYLAVDEWPHPYSREVAVFPVPELRRMKYWPVVSRIDGAHGDRNLICECPSIDEFR